MSQPRSRPVVGMLVAATLALTAAGAGAAEPTACAIDAFQMGPQPADASNRPTGVVATWDLAGSSTVRCSGAGVVAIDVWEHAVIGFPAGGGPVRGQAEGFLIWDGEVVSWSGQVRGTAECAGAVCQLTLAVRGTAGRAARVRLPQAGVLNLGGPAVTMIIDAADYVVWR